MTSITHSKSWNLLKKHHEEFFNSHMRDLFHNDPNRFNKFNLKFNDLLFDFSNKKWESTGLGRYPLILVVKFHVECNQSHVWEPLGARDMSISIKTTNIYTYI